jgi:hypothetical protein
MLHGVDLTRQSLYAQLTGTLCVCAWCVVVLLFVSTVLVRVINRSEACVCEC